jgi:hypothetical protein
MTQISGQKADSFSAKLNRELGALDWKTRNDLLLKIGRMELRMKATGRERPEWMGPLPEDRLLGADVVIPTEQGERRGRVICFGVLNTGGETWERSVIVHSAASGTQHEAPGSSARLATMEDAERIQGELVMAEKLVVAADAAQKGTIFPTHDRPKKRGQKDPKLIEEMLAAAKSAATVSDIDDGTTNYKISGAGGKRIYLFKTQLRVDISGFSVDHPGIRKISDDEARDMHLGKVRGQFLFDDREVSLSAFKAALEALAA